jgi:hypothetical protein
MLLHQGKLKGLRAAVSEAVLKTASGHKTDDALGRMVYHEAAYFHPPERSPFVMGMGPGKSAAVNASGRKAQSAVGTLNPEKVHDGKEPDFSAWGKVKVQFYPRRNFRVKGIMFRVPPEGKIGKEFVNAVDRRFSLIRAKGVSAGAGKAAGGIAGLQGQPQSDKGRRF